MLSYMLPVEEKSTVGGAPDKGRLQLELAGEEAGRHQHDLPSDASDRPRLLKSSIISKESSVSSFAGSDLTTSSMTPTTVDKPKLKLLGNGTKHTTLKRVSFGSSKGSMVETLIYESPLQEEPESTSPVPQHETPFPFPADVGDQEESERSKVRVSFLQGVCSQSVAEQQLQAEWVEQAESAHLDLPAMAAEADHALAYNRQASTESGWDNPFRPDGDLSREADEIVSLIRVGKPITPTPTPTTLLTASIDQTDLPVNNSVAGSPIVQSPEKQVKSAKIEASIKNGASNGGGEGAVEVQRTTAKQEPLQPEHVTLKKNPKCKCCVIQ